MKISHIMNELWFCDIAALCCSLVEHASITHMPIMMVSQVNSLQNLVYLIGKLFAVLIFVNLMQFKIND